MKKALTPFLLAAVFVSTVVFASAKGPLKEKHTGKVGLDGAKVNCVYCHTTAANPKTKGNDLQKLKKEKYCAIPGCHPEVDKK